MGNLGGGLGKAGRLLPKTPLIFLSLAFARFSRYDREPVKANAAKPFFVHPGSKPRLQRAADSLYFLDELLH